MKDDRQQTTEKRSGAWVFAVALTLLAFIPRVFQLDLVSLRGDEAFTVIFVQRTWEGLWRGIRFIEPNPPLYYLALRVWVAIAGASEFAARYFSAFFGVLCVPLMYRLTFVIASEAKQSPGHGWGLLRRRFAAPRNDTVALFAAALIAINPYQIWHSQDARNYTLWPALSLLALIFFFRWWNLETGNWKLEIGRRDLSSVIVNLSFYVLATLASLYTHYYDTFILVAENVFVFLFAFLARRWKMAGRWAIAQIALVLLYAPWVLFGTNRVTTYGEGSAYGGVPLWEQFTRTLATFVVSDTVPDQLKSIVALPLALVVVAALIFLARQNRERAAFLFLWIAIPTLALWTISIGRPLFLERYLNAIAPAYYLVFAIGLAQVSSLRFQVSRLTFYVSRFTFFLAILFFLATSAFALANYYFNPAYAKSPDWRALAQFIAARQQPGDIVVQNFTEMSAIYYQRGAAPVITLPKDFNATADDEKRLRQLLNEYRRIWFIPAQPDWWDPDHVIEHLLARTADRELETRISVFRPQLYLSPREFESKMMAVNARVGNATLVGYRVEGTRHLRVTLYWRSAKKTEKDATVFVHLADTVDRVIAQHDGTPVRGTYPTSAWQPGELVVDGYELEVDAAPGTYSIIVGMYDPATLERLPASDANGARLQNDRVLLTQITILQ